MKSGKFMWDYFDIDVNYHQNQPRRKSFLGGNSISWVESGNYARPYISGKVPTSHPM